MEQLLRKLIGREVCLLIGGGHKVKGKLVWVGDGPSGVIELVTQNICDYGNNCDRQVSTVTRSRTIISQLKGFKFDDKPSQEEAVLPEV